jgi:iron complex outermembrane recepter protein
MSYARTSYVQRPRFKPLRNIRFSFMQLHRPLVAPLILPITLFLSATALLAQPTDDTLQIVQNPEVTVTALRVPLAAGNVPYALSTAILPEGAPGISLGELLAKVPGVQVENRFNAAVGERITIRGFGTRSQFGVRGIRVMLDGLPMTFADGQSALEGIETPTITRAEVIRGPASALYGNASGGVILLRSAPPSALPFELGTSFSGSSNRMFRGSARLSGTTGPATYSASYSSLDDGGFRDHSRSHTNRAGADASYRVDDANRLSLGFGWTDFDALNPGSLTRALADANPLQAFATNVRQKTGKSGTQIQTSAGWSNRGKTSGAAVMAHLILRTITNPIPDRIIELDRTAGGARATINGTLDPDGTALGWNGGVDFDLQSDSRKNFANSSGERGGLLVDQEETVSALGPWLQLSLPIGSELLAMGSLRYDRVLFSVVDHRIDTADPDDSGDRTMDALSPSFGLVWKPGSGLSLYTNVATAFETPTTTELANRPDGAGGFNPDLQPQRTLSVEAGVRGAGPLGSRYHLALYNAIVTDALIPFQVPDVPGRDFYRNAGSAIHRGVEIGLSVPPLDNTVLSIAYSLTDARFGADEVDGVSLEGNFLPGVARNRLSAEILWLPLDLLHLRLQGSGSEGEFGDDANSERIRGHFLLGMSVTSAMIASFGTEAWGSRIGITAGVDNLLDRAYTTATAVNAFGRRYYEPGPGRTFYLRIDGAFGKTIETSEIESGE